MFRSFLYILKLLVFHKNRKLIVIFREVAGNTNAICKLHVSTGFFLRSSKRHPLTLPSTLDGRILLVCLACLGQVKKSFTAF